VRLHRQHRVRKSKAYTTERQPTIQRFRTADMRQSPTPSAFAVLGGGVRRQIVRTLCLAFLLDKSVSLEKLPWRSIGTGL
jgi:hypothetical protein